MDKINFVIFLLGLYFFLRAFMAFSIHMDMYFYRDRMCIKRILRQQKACDLLNALYQLMVMLVNICTAVIAVLSLFDVNTECIRIFNIASLIVVSISCIVFFIFKFRLESKYDLMNFYNDMIDYRSKEKVHTEDNDNEVSFIRSYQKVIKRKTYINVWILLFWVLFIFVY